VPRSLSAADCAAPMTPRRETFENERLAKSNRRVLLATPPEDHTGDPSPGRSSRAQPATIKALR
jgi:hypothetical protein